MSLDSGIELAVLFTVSQRHSPNGLPPCRRISDYRKRILYFYLCERSWGKYLTSNNPCFGRGGDVEASRQLCEQAQSCFSFVDQEGLADATADVYAAVRGGWGV